MANELPEYDAVYVVSDLHLGGYDGEFWREPRNYRIFRDEAALSWFVNALSTGTPAALAASAGDVVPATLGRVALVLNGDIVDFLADAEAKCFDWQFATEKLKNAIGDRAQSVVWKSLQTYVASKRGDLVLVLGNHDLELSLPEPQNHLLHFLTEGQHDRRGRVVFAMDGAGFSCTVQGARVLCLHGNEADPWNATDYWRLNLIRRALARGSLRRNFKVLSEWIPNAGTQMVIEYMNGLKRQYQWVDLLKPEEEAAAMVTAALANAPRLRMFAEVKARRSEAERKLRDGFLGGSDGAGALDDAPPSPARIGPASQAEVQTLLRDSMDSLARGARPEDFAEGEDFLMKSSDMASDLALASKVARLKVWPSGLREILSKTLANDKTFLTDTKDPTFEELDELCSGDIDFLIAGHTHLHRALERERHRGKFYFNSGTWIRLVEIPKDALSADIFPEVERRLRQGSMGELEAKIAGPSGPLSLLKEVRTVVRVAGTTSGAQGNLMTVEPAGDSWHIVKVDNTTFPRSPST